MEIRQLEYFLMVNQAGSFTRAAERLFVSQPAVTNAVRSLEEELGIQLFDRSQKQAILTAEGRIFCAHAEHVMQGISTTLDEIRAIKNLSSGKLRLGLTGFAALPPVMRLIKLFRESYPNIEVELVESSCSDLLAQLIDDKLDLAILLGVDGEKAPPALTQLNLPSQEMAVCCSRQHRLRRKNSLALSELASEALLIPSENAIAKILQEVKITVSSSIQSRHAATLMNLASLDCGLALLPESLGLTNEELTVIPLEPAIFVIPTIFSKTGRHLSHAATAFLELAQKGVGDHA